MRRALAAASPLLLLATGAIAQSANDTIGDLPLTQPAGCLAKPPAFDESRQLIYLEARMAPHTPSAFAAQSQLLAKEVDDQLRALLGGSASAVPIATSKIEWRALPAELVTVARSDGRMRWRGSRPPRDSSAVALLSAAVDSARHHGGALMIWPDDRVLDSIDFRLSLVAGDYPAAALFDTTYTAHCAVRGGCDSL